MAEGNVIRTDPVEGSEVDAGTSVILYVSLGPEEKLIDMPNVTGIQLETARTLLQQSGLKVNKVNTDPSSDRPAGTVIQQDPAAGTPVSYTHLDVYKRQHKINLIAEGAQRLGLDCIKSALGDASRFREEDVYKRQHQNCRCGGFSSRDPGAGQNQEDRRGRYDRPPCEKPGYPTVCRKS